jgi:hypothetical protein
LPLSGVGEAQVLQGGAVRSVMVPYGEFEQRQAQRKQDFGGPVFAEVRLEEKKKK